LKTPDEVGLADERPAQGDEIDYPPSDSPFHDGQRPQSAEPEYGDLERALNRAATSTK
jgi:hypothetical protein